MLAEMEGAPERGCVEDQPPRSNDNFRMRGPATLMIDLNSPPD